MLAEADHGLTQQAFEQAQDNTYAEFFLHPKEDIAASLKEGRPIFSEVPYIKVMVPGDKDIVVVRPVRAKDKARYPRQWAAFEAQEAQPLEGTPLEEWPGITRSQVAELKHFGVHTVENLANMPDSQAGKFMAIGALKAKALNYVAQCRELAPLAQLQEENEALKGRIEALEYQLRELGKAEVKPKRASRKAAQE